MQFNELLALTENSAVSLAQIEQALIDSHKKAAANIEAIGQAQEAYDRAALGRSLSEAVQAKQRLLVAQVERDRLAALIRLLQRKQALAAAIAMPGGNLDEYFPCLSKTC